MSLIRSTSVIRGFFQFDTPGMKPTAIIFDFDGTLADSYEAIAASVNHVRANHGLAPLSIAEVRGHVGHGPHYLIEHTVGAGSVDQDLAAYRAHHPSVL